MQNPLRDPQETSPVTYCQRCQGEVYPGETTYAWEAQTLCQDCFQARVQAFVQTFPTQAALELGISMVHYPAQKGVAFP